MKQVSVEKFIERIGCEVFPITIIKFLLNKRKIISYFAKASEPDFEIRAKYSLDHSDCELCQEKKEDGILCRQHTSIQRVLNARNVGYDLDTNTYFFKNEIFRRVGDKLVIIYCPHPKLITGEITDSKVRKINPITISLENEAIQELPEYDGLKEFISSDLMDQNLRCWFNYEFSLVTLPEDRHRQNFCLIPNNK